MTSCAKAEMVDCRQILLRRAFFGFTHALQQPSPDFDVGEARDEPHILMLMVLRISTIAFTLKLGNNLICFMVSLDLLARQLLRKWSLLQHQKLRG